MLDAFRAGMLRYCVVVQRLGFAHLMCRRVRENTISLLICCYTLVFLWHVIQSLCLAAGRNFYGYYARLVLLTGRRDERQSVGSPSVG